QIGDFTMRVIRVRYQESTFYASLLDKEVQPLQNQDTLPQSIPLQEVQILPLVMPTKVICVGLNYHAHAQELGMEVPEEPLLFLKPPSAVIGTGQSIVYPGLSQEVHYEGELAVVVGKQGRNISPEQAQEHIFGYCCANDVTARDLQRKDLLYTRAKGFDTFCPIGPWIETSAPDILDLEISTYVNSQLRQTGNTADMISGPLELISYISKVMSLWPGDVILTGTPPGVGQVQPGDEVQVQIQDLGVLSNPVVAE
ncbi:MAG: fumarylacetoacetate hydrolase family protein, partial [Thermodesulfobacteriota bacterium]